MNETATQASTDPPAPPPKALRLHRACYASSALRTLLFYASVLALCVFFPVCVTLAIALFFLFFYRQHIRTFFKKPLETLAGNPDTTSFTSLEPLPPGASQRPSPKSGKPETRTSVDGSHVEDVSG